MLTLAHLKKWALHTIFNIINIKLNSAVAMHNNENPIHTHILPKGIFVSNFNITLHLHIKCIYNIIDRLYYILLLLHQMKFDLQ